MYTYMKGRDEGGTVTCTHKYAKGLFLPSMAHMWISHVTYVNESCHVHACLAVHIRLGICVISQFICVIYASSRSYLELRLDAYITHMNAVDLRLGMCVISYHTYECVKSQLPGADRWRAHILFTPAPHRTLQHTLHHTLQHTLQHTTPHNATHTTTLQHTLGSNTFYIWHFRQRLRVTL